jgi:tRNA uridine 5-carbamoylmethylation protein Kti12
MKTLSEFLNEGVYDPAIFKVIFLAGGPGSGKSYVARNLALRQLGFITINSDVPFEYIMKKVGLSLEMPETEEYERNLVRDSAKMMTKNKMDYAIGGRLGLVVDGTGKDFSKIMKLKTALESKGYESAMIFVNTDLETALSRNKMRERSVPEKLVIQYWNEVQSNMGHFQNKFHRNFYIVDNSDKKSVRESVSEINEAVVSNMMRVFKEIKKWSTRPPIKPEAKAWIQEQLNKKAIM